MPLAAQRQCRAEGGTVVRDGEGSFQVCHKTFTDGGKICRKASDCQGNCVIDGADAVQGTCAKTTIFYGCNWWLDEKGKPAGGACID